MRCTCKTELVEVLIDLTRKSDGKIAEEVTAKYCEECNTYFVNFGGITFE